MNSASPCLSNYLQPCPQTLSPSGSSIAVGSVWCRRNGKKHVNRSPSSVVQTQQLRQGVDCDCHHWERRCQNRWHHGTHGRFHPNRNSRREKSQEVKGEADQRLERSPIYNH